MLRAITATNPTVRPLDACGFVLVGRRALRLRESKQIKEAYVTP